ncbi:Sec63 Brl domain-containing protein [Fimicolochytrium jonesii]|uniref:Sec63 Brl domain-containing protein n=1 Tax=Fimicolochytrium jonesii TaxID=1396493 RepID=UPI0022FEFF41|nr:Sec63 Brl domain-containing protein [Fimicolochytrium jonesii]KAI8825871.1 Sec63 Brl domain-containing protein [Fimicolochytrium jonesii]
MWPQCTKPGEEAGRGLPLMPRSTSRQGGLSKPSFFNAPSYRSTRGHEHSDSGSASSFSPRSNRDAYPTPSSSNQMVFSPPTAGTAPTFLTTASERSVFNDFNAFGRPKVKASKFLDSNCSLWASGNEHNLQPPMAPPQAEPMDLFTGDIERDILLDAGRYGDPRYSGFGSCMPRDPYSEQIAEVPYQLTEWDSEAPPEEPEDHHFRRTPNFGTTSEMENRFMAPPVQQQCAFPLLPSRQALKEFVPKTVVKPPAVPKGGNDGLTVNGIRLRRVADLPDKFRSLFKFPYFNAVQSECYDKAFCTDENLVVSAPTGSGKTCIMELAVLHLLSRPDGENAKVVYMAPTKALCSERVRDWQQKFRTLGITCNELTGDSDNLRTCEIQQSNIIVTTPEKWDSMTRKWRDYKNLMSLLRLIMIDECHTLNEPGRGATLEVVVSRMKTVNAELRRQGGPNGQLVLEIRFLAVSATVPNIMDIAEWLKSAHGTPAQVRVFGEEFRPVQLRKEVLGFFAKSANYFQFEASLDYKLMEVIERFSAKKPSLVFCSTRKSVTTCAERLAKECVELCSGSNGYGPMHPFVKTRNLSDTLRGIKNRITDRKLAELVVHGIGFHHGGLSTQDRQLIESSFLQGHISVVCATSTLAVGVNLPAHVVIIKGTMQYVNNNYVKYSELDLLQMLGRAGRPQFDDSGVAVIMTMNNEVPTYQAMVTGKQVIESSLHENLIEHLNSEVVLNAIKSVQSAKEWLQSSFLYVRMRKNPAYYKLKNCSNVEGKLSAEKRLESICLRDIELLDKHSLITLSRSTQHLQTTEYGQAMAKYYIKYQTAVTILSMKEKGTLKDALETLCKAEEFSDIRFRGDKAIFNAVNKNPAIRFPVKGKVTTGDQKVNLLIQCRLACISLSDQKTSHTLNMEQAAIISGGSRIARFMVDVFKAKGDVVSLRSATDLSRCLAAKTWENSPLLLQQIESVGPAIARMLSTAGISSFGQLEKTDPRQIEYVRSWPSSQTDRTSHALIFQVSSRNPPFGNKILEAARALPKLKLEITQFKDMSRPTEIELYVNVSLLNAEVVKVYGKKGPLQVAFLAATSDGNLIDHRRLSLKKVKDGESFRVRVQLDNARQRISCSLLPEDYG